MNDKGILKALSSGEFFVSFHGLERMMERKVLEVDIRSVARTCTAIFLQEHGTWKVDELDTYKNPLTVIVAEENGIIIVTVY
jgi:hypothetical protein